MKLLLILLLISQSLLAVHLSKEQIATLQKVRDIAKGIKTKDGISFENTLTAICLTESSGGIHIIGDFKEGQHITKASLGAMQIQVATARYVAKKSPTLRWLNKFNDDQIANLLVSSTRMSAAIAAHYLRILRERRDDYFKAISGYNGGMENYRYYNKVMENLALVKKLVYKGVLV
jgi:hypothetical protein